MKKYKVLIFDMILHFKFIYIQNNYNYDKPNIPLNCAFTHVSSYLHRSYIMS
jgi:hypothetical protein